jgi:RNA polymerase sigma-70 factor, ECF subfamily
VVSSSTCKDPGSRVAAEIVAAHNGCQEALGSLLDRYRPYLLRAANAHLDAHLKVKGSGSDLVQETFLDAQRAFHRFHGTTASDLIAWLHGILSHKIATFTRRYRHTAKRQIAREVALDQPGPGMPTAPAPCPSSQLMQAEQTEALTRALERLPEHYRQVIRLRQWDGLSFEEIAASLERSVDATRMLWWRAIDRLQRELLPQQEAGD